VGINLSPQVLDYFKALADETGLPYQKLIDLYLLDCPCSAGLSPELWGAPSASRLSLSGVPTMCVGKPGIFLCCAKKRKKLTMKWVA
jgi:hypothetical protein